MTRSQAHEAVPLPDVLTRLTDYVARHASSRPDDLACVGSGTEHTWASLWEAVNRAADTLLQAGVGHGDRVALRGRPDADFLVTYLASLRIGAVFLGVNPAYTTGETAALLVRARPVVAVDLLDPPQLHDAAPALQLLTLEQLSTGRADSAAVSAAAALVDSTDAACLVFTSGSTGTPKGALLPHRGLTLCSAVQAEHIGLTPHDRVLCNLPVNHVGTLGNIVATTLVGGATLVFDSEFSAQGTLDTIRLHQATVWGSVPTVFALCSGLPTFPDADLSSVRVVAFSGGSMPRDLLTLLLRRFGDVRSSYGLTETVGELTFARADDADLSATIGAPEPRYDIRVVTDDGQLAAPGQTGEIRVREDFTMLGYLDDPLATADSHDDDGYLRTGDLAEVLTGGELRLVGRTSEVFKSGGYNVYPKEVESVLESHPRITTAAVVDVPHPVFGQVGAGFLQTDGPLDESEIRAWLSEHLANYKHPKTFQVLDVLPLLPVGKVDKQRLRASVAPR